MSKIIESRAALVIGAGVGGIRAALDLAEAGHKVYLCERSSSIGGMAAYMDKWFPDLHCNMCQLLPALNRNLSSQYCLRRGLVHENIEVLFNSEVQKVEGEAGEFKVEVRSVPTGVEAELCTGCGRCADVCPVKISCQSGTARKAIDLANPSAMPRIYSIDWGVCTRCGACAAECPNAAIQLDSPPEVRLLEAGAIILVTGFAQFDAVHASQYGYKRYHNVVTNLEFERMMSAGGHSAGRLIRPSDGQTPKSVAFLQCVGSREHQRDYCSSTCCMAAVKEASLVKESLPETEVAICFMDLRAYGKGCYRSYQQAKKNLGVQFIRGRIPVVKEDPLTRNLILSVMTDGKLPLKRQFDMVVLSVGQIPSLEFKETCRALGVETNEWGFCRTPHFATAETTRDGIYVCGSAAGPKDIADTITEAGATASGASKWLGPIITPSGQPENSIDHASDEQPRVGVVLCSCGGEIGSILNLPEIISHIDGTSHVDFATVMPYLCRQETQQLREKLHHHKINRLVLGMCSQYCQEPALRKTAEEWGLKKDFIRGVNIREEVAWVHLDHPDKATARAKDLIHMSVEKVLQAEQRLSVSVSTIPRGLVIGGGFAGLTAALTLAENGLEVELLERTEELGGNAREVYATLEGDDVQQLLAETSARVKLNNMVHVHLGSELVQIKGYVGNFEVTVKSGDVLTMYGVGAIVIASGAGKHKTEEYLYGLNNRVITQQELEKRLACGEIEAQELRSVAMIQCVGSREDQHPYCSRVCCSAALKNALSLKALNPELEIVVFHRDIMSYGFKEQYYTRARESGIQFIRYDTGKKPTVKQGSERLIVEADEPVLGGRLVFQPDLVILSTGIVANDNRQLAQVMGVETDEDGFFREAEEKFRPVDSSRNGIFICGLANSPHSIGESIIQARASAQRVVSLLLRGKMESSQAISETITRKCRRCELCVRTCPYGARVKNDETDEIMVIEALCQGCGACAVACPSGAARLCGAEPKTVMAMLDIAF